MIKDNELETNGYIVERTEDFKKWLKNLKDIQAKTAILARITRIETDGFFGETKGVGDNVSELKFHVGAGYRVYYTIRGNTVVFLLHGGSKHQQQKDITKAKAICNDLEN